MDSAAFARALPAFCGPSWTDSSIRCKGTWSLRTSPEGPYAHLTALPIFLQSQPALVQIDSNELLLGADPEPDPCVLASRSAHDASTHDVHFYDFSLCWSHSYQCPVLFFRGYVRTTLA